MEFNIDTILQDMLSAVRQEAGDGWSAVKEATHQFAERKKDRYKLVAELTVSGHITTDKFKSIVEDEKLLLESELLALAVISKSTAQKAANAALEILQTAVMALIP